MAEIKKIEVFYEKFVVGQIIIQDQQLIHFVYTPNWLATERNFPLSIKLPLDKGKFDDYIIVPWLINLLPEGQQLTNLSRALGLSVSDPISILREIGGDTAGAISIGEPSDRNVWDYETLLQHYELQTQQEALERHFEDLKLRPFLVGEDGVRLSLAGGQEKSALAILDESGHPKLGLPKPKDLLAIPKKGAPSTIIVKPDNPYLPGIVENEAYCLTLAKLIGIKSVDCTTIETSNRTALAVARYDRTLRNDSSIRRLHQEDFAQANSIFPAQKYEQGIYSGLDLQTLLLTGNYLPTDQALKLLDQVIFNILVANTDAHAKNYSIILSGEPAIAPLYDVSTVLIWDHVNQYHAQKIAGKKRKPVNIDKRHWEQIANNAGLNARGVCQRVQKLVDYMVAARNEAIELVSNQPGSKAKIVRHIAKLVEENALRIAGRLKPNL